MVLDNPKDREEFLAKLTPAERAEALAAEAAARRAEERAEQRELERILAQKQAERRREQNNHASTAAESSILAENEVLTQQQQRVVFIPKRKREQLQNNEPSDRITKKKPEEVVVKQAAAGSTTTTTSTAEETSLLSEKERKIIQESYLGKSAFELENEDGPRKKKQTTKKITFKFRWENTDDTFPEDDPLYASMLPRSVLDTTNNRKKLKEQESNDSPRQAHLTVWNKPIAQMTPRDWRIFRENYEITVKGGRAPPPMRSFRESPSPELPSLHPSLLDAIENVMRFKEPSPIQRQAIPVGLQRRDLIGIAETGSGKTIAFGVPLCHYLLNLPTSVLNSVADQGALAMVVAPTRELALQIEVELRKLLSRQNILRTCVIVGGQSIQQQAQEIRNGVHIIVGTPGRLNECIEMAYLVLNQCCYIVMDEADRMIDMGFAPQMESILDAMGGAMKSEDEKETYRQEQEDLRNKGVARHRLTVMFSATMPSEVELIAKRYLRHPCIISIGDEDSGKNARIVQKIIWLASPSKKEEALRNVLRDPRFAREKIIVFVNEKKHADGVGRMVERAGRKCVVLHGGKSQDQREENLDEFRRGNCVLVATDVAGRGLDIPDVQMVVNFDLPTRSIENYTHRIGRTGRAGKEGYAVSFITEEDQRIMAPLKNYLESTGNEVPQRLARHPAAQTGVEVNTVMY